MLDLSKPEHREALQWVCRNREAAALVGPLGLPKAPEAVAARALSSPAESAAIVRAELERCGVKNADIRMSDRGADSPRLRSGISIVVWEENETWPEISNAALYQWVAIDMIAGVILRLLDATTREDALAALRGGQ